MEQLVILGTVCFVVLVFVGSLAMFVTRLAHEIIAARQERQAERAEVEAIRQSLIEDIETSRDEDV